MSFLSNKYKLDVKAYETQVAKFISHTDTATIRLGGNNLNFGHTIFSHSETSNFYIAVGENASNTSNMNNDTIAVFNNKNINFYKDTVIRGNLVIDGYVATLGIDVVLEQEDLFVQMQSYTDITSNLLMPKYLNIANRGILSTSNAIMQMIPSLSERLYIDGLDVVTSNAETIYFLQNSCNYTIDRFENRFNSKTADNIAEGVYHHYIVNNKYLHNMLSITGDLWASNIYSAHGICAENIYANEYYADGSKLKNIYIGGSREGSTIDAVQEGSNLFFRPEHMADLLQSCNMDASNYANETFRMDYYHNAMLFYDIYDYINVGISDASNYTDIINVIYDADMQADNSNFIMYNEAHASNYLIYMNIIEECYGKTDALSNLIMNSLAEGMTDASNFVLSTCNILYNDMHRTRSYLTQSADTLFNEIQEIIYTRYNNVSNAQWTFLQIEDDIVLLRDYIRRSSNEFALYQNELYANFSNSIPVQNIVNVQYDKIDRIYSDINDFMYTMHASSEHSNQIKHIYSNTCNLLYTRGYNETSNLLLASSNYLNKELIRIYVNVLDYGNDLFNNFPNYLQYKNDILFNRAYNIYDEIVPNLNSKIDELNTELVAEGTSNFYYNEAKFDEMFSTLTNDHIADGNTNRWIVNGTYAGNLRILGTLYASNIVIDGKVSTISTDIYQSGSCKIASSNAGNLLNITNTVSDIFRAYDSDNRTVLHVNNSNVFMGNAFDGGNDSNDSNDSNDNLQISGVIYANIFQGYAKNIQNITLYDRNTDLLPEGSNLYLTDDRVANLIAMSNINTSNYILSIANNAREFVQLNSYILSDSNIFDKAMQYKDTSNYLHQSVADISKLVIDEDGHLYDYVQNISNEIMGYFSMSDFDTSNYLLRIMPDALSLLNGLDYDTSNYIQSVNADISITLPTMVYNENISNYISRTSNELGLHIYNSTIIQDQSNYLHITCNLLYQGLLRINTYLQDYGIQTSNQLVMMMKDGMYGVGSVAGVGSVGGAYDYLRSTSNELMNYAYNMLSNLNLVTNVYIMQDVYAGDKILQSNFSSYESVHVRDYNDSDSRIALDMMRKEGFVVHFVFKSKYLVDTPIYRLGGDSISVIDIKILYGFLYVSIGYKQNSVSIFSQKPIVAETWYTADIVVYLNNGNKTISFKMFLNTVEQDIIMISDFCDNRLMSEMPIATYHNNMNYLYLVVACNPVIAPANLASGIYYMVFDNPTITYTVSFTNNTHCKILMIAGGGGGGYNYGGGGGAGAYYYNANYLFNAGTYTFKVGNGGNGGRGGNSNGESEISPQNGEDTCISFGGNDVLRCKGGGHGGSYASGYYTGGNGGCGGGGLGWDKNFLGERTYAGGSANNAGTAGMGYSGGSGFNAFGKTILSGGGGGGIGGTGQSATLLQKEGGNGGDGLVFNIRGRDEVLGGGGGGGEWSISTNNPAGLGGGANLNGNFIRVGGKAGRNEGEMGTDGMPNTGSGGGSGRNASGGAGGSGIIILQYTVNETLSMTVGTSNYENNQGYLSGFFYTNSYYSSNYAYQYKYSSNISAWDGNFYDNADSRLGLATIADLDFVQTEVIASVKFTTGYYFFILDLQNEIVADLFIGNVHVARLSQTTANPLYIVNGYYRFYLKTLRSIENRNIKYIIPRYKYMQSWDGISYNLNKTHDIIYDQKALANTQNDFQLFTGNDKTSNMLHLQEIKIVGNPLTTGTDHYIKNVLFRGYDSDVITTRYKLKTNRWQEDANNTWIYYNEGNVAIGNTIPVNASLDINTNLLGNSYSVKTNKGVWTNLGIIASSDERIKMNICDVNDKRALEDILKIEPKAYKYVNNGKMVYGFIAQQIAEVIPNAVRIQGDFIPNIYKEGVIKGGILYIQGVNSVLNIGDKILIDDQGEKIIHTIARYDTYDNDNDNNNDNDNHNMNILIWLENIDHVVEDKEVFVYGTWVQDFHALDKSYIYSLNVGALQELYKNYQEIEKQIEDIYKCETVIDELASNVQEINWEKDDIQYDYNILNNVQTLQQDNYELLKSISVYNDSIYTGLQQELQSIEYDNAILVSCNLMLTEEYNDLADAINIQMNEITTIKTILAVNNIMI